MKRRTHQGLGLFVALAVWCWTSGKQEAILAHRALAGLGLGALPGHSAFQ